MIEDELIYQRLDGEKELYYNMFVFYSDLGFGRTITQVAEKFECSKKHVYSIAKKFKWAERIAKIDKRLLDNSKDQENIKFQKSVRNRRAVLVDLYEDLQYLANDLIEFRSLFVNKNNGFEKFFKNSERYIDTMKKYNNLSVQLEKTIKDIGHKKFSDNHKIHSEHEKLIDEVKELNENDIPDILKFYEDNSKVHSDADQVMT